MKKAINKIKVTAAGLMIILFTSLQVLASGTDSTANLKFVGTQKNQPTFELNLNNADEEEYIVLVRDSNNDLLYTGKLEGKNITKKFRFNIYEGDFSSVFFNVRFEITNVKTNQKQMFNVTKNTHQVEDVLVAKL